MATKLSARLTQNLTLPQMCWLSKSAIVKVVEEIDALDINKVNAHLPTTALHLLLEIRRNILELPTAFSPTIPKRRICIPLYLQAGWCHANEFPAFFAEVVEGFLHLLVGGEFQDFVFECRHKPPSLGQCKKLTVISFHML